MKDLLYIYNPEVNLELIETTLASLTAENLIASKLQK